MAKAHGKIGHFPMVYGHFLLNRKKRQRTWGEGNAYFYILPLSFSLWSRKVAEKIKVGNHTWKSATEICDENELGIT